MEDLKDQIQEEVMQLSEVLSTDENSNSWAMYHLGRLELLVDQLLPKNETEKDSD